MPHPSPALSYDMPESPAEEFLVIVLLAGEESHEPVSIATETKQGPLRRFASSERNFPLPVSQKGLEESSSRSKKLC